MKVAANWLTKMVFGFIGGFIIIYIDNFAFQGEVSPIVVVAMLLAATFIAGIFWEWQGWNAAAVVWACIPAAHIIKHVLGFPDTLHPNTYGSILMLAAFTLVISVLGFGCGIPINRALKSKPSVTREN